MFIYLLIMFAAWRIYLLIMNNYIEYQHEKIKYDIRNIRPAEIEAILTEFGDL